MSASDRQPLVAMNTRQPKPLVESLDMMARGLYPTLADRSDVIRSAVTFWLNGVLLSARRDGVITTEDLQQLNAEIAETHNLQSPDPDQVARGVDQWVLFRESVQYLLKVMGERGIRHARYPATSRWVGADGEPLELAEPEPVTAGASADVGVV